MLLYLHLKILILYDDDVTSFAMYFKQHFQNIYRNKKILPNIMQSLLFSKYISNTWCDNVTIQVRIIGTDYRVQTIVRHIHSACILHIRMGTYTSYLLHYYYYL